MRYAHDQMLASGAGPPPQEGWQHMPISDVPLAVADHQERADDYVLFRDYYHGKHLHPYATEAFRDKYDWLLHQARANKCHMVVRNFTDRVSLSAWSGAGAKRADAVAETTGLLKVLNLATREAWRAGDAYVLAWPGRDGTVKPHYHRADAAGFKLSDDDPDAADWFYKIWVAAGGHGRVNMYYEDRVERFVTTHPVHTSQTGETAWPVDANGYQPVTNDADGDTITYGTQNVPSFDGRIPWVHLPLEPDEQGGHGRSILTDVVPLQDGLNHTLASMIVGVEQFGEPLRALMNYAPNKWIDPHTGEATEEALRFDQTRNRIFGVKGPGPLTQLDPPDSTNLLKVLEWFSAEIANEVGIPVSDISPDLGNIPSGTALRVLAAARTSSITNYTETITPQVHGLMHVLGVPDAFPTWTDPSPTDEKERWEIAIVQQDAGVSFRESMRAMGKDDADITRMLEESAEDSSIAGQVAMEAFRQGRDPAAVIRG